MTVKKRSFDLVTPIAITGFTFTKTDTVTVELKTPEAHGRGEGIGVYFKNETAQSIMADLERVRSEVEAGVSREEAQKLLPPGGARNALDCALWDLDCKKQGKSIWQLLGITPKPLTTVATVGIDTPSNMAARAKDLVTYSFLKIKLDGEKPIKRLKAIRKARPDARLIVDVNQGWSYDKLKECLPDLMALDIEMVEQPLARDLDASLETLKSPIPLTADESCIGLTEYGWAKRRYNAINIKLDKCGGLTEALKIIKKARRDGIDLMVGNMTGSSLSMAPAFVVGQFCKYVDIDGPLNFKSDIENAMTYAKGGEVAIPSTKLWG